MDFLCCAQSHKLIILMFVCNSEKNYFSLGNLRVATDAIISWPPWPIFVRQPGKAATVTTTSAAGRPCCRYFLFCKIQTRPRPRVPCQPWRPCHTQQPNNAFVPIVSLSGSHLVIARELSGRCQISEIWNFFTVPMELKDLSVLFMNIQLKYLHISFYITKKYQNKSKNRIIIGLSPPTLLCLYDSTYLRSLI